MKSTYSYILKVIAGGLIAVIVLSVFSLAFYNPLDPVAQPDNITNYKFAPNQKWYYTMEGFGYGTIGENGYNSSYYPQCYDPDVVVLGSSHMEAVHVPADKNCIYLLNEKMVTDSITDNDFQCINLGISGHHFGISVSNFENVFKTWDNVKYVIIETSNINFSTNELTKMLGKEYSVPENGNGLGYKLSKSIPYMALVLRQIRLINQKGTTTSAKTISKEEILESYEHNMSSVLENISSIAEKNGAKLLILYHSRFDFNRDMSTSRCDDSDYLKIFTQACKENNITLIDPTHRFMSHYEKTFEPAYGFSNSTPGDGHLNEVGHKIISDELYKTLNVLEEAK